MRECVQRFPGDPDLARKKLAELLVGDPPGFRAASLAILQDLVEPASRRCVLELLLKGGLAPVCDPEVIGLDAEVALAKELFELDPQLDMKLARRLSGVAAESMPEEVVQRILVLLNAVPENSRVLPMLIRLMRHPSASVRSKAALVIGRASKTPQVMEDLLAEPDARVRANAIEALWWMDSAKARLVLEEASSDSNNRVVGNALLGLYRMGETSAIPKIVRMAVHPKAEFRTTAAWVMEQTGSPRFLPVLARMVRESNPAVRTWVFRAISKLKRAASGAADLPRLRVYLTGASSESGGGRTVRAVIAGPDGREIQKLPATSMVLWEDCCVITDYAARPLPRPRSMALGLVIPLGDTGDRALASLSPWKRDSDRWQECRYAEGSLPGALEQAFSFLATATVDRHMILVAPPAPSDPPDQAPWEPVLQRARAMAASVQVIPDGAEDAGSASASGEKAYLSLLCGYDITSHGNGEPADPQELKLEVFVDGRYGVDVLRLPASGSPAGETVSPR